MDFFAEDPQPPASRGRSVSFDDQLEMKLIENVSIDHKDDLWFSDEEIESFEQRHRSFLRKLKSNNMNIDRFAELLSGQDTSAFLGLENYLSESSLKAIVFRRKALSMAIQLEQKRQSSAGIRDSKRLAHISEVGSQPATKRARIIALLHADD
mmetsp:Transcript_11897/g.20662  ORF Transcript_11897/g.20662 Transcript_11897/m.20662 type:complete len:153 (-) Transcript_11897:93-551(-)|eukprot:CAMPEP_0183724438 /NCGR_PEP_ID=MMETSP0737-20130205/17931_1 /TAXON_ID=385413 /ORGANISM="Thalassiosira miniscula, Strain CCMP1093" /LENGTH=152 /DNA_ID=CAMNT_0025955023 /DNA_START=18 /DNA_END=476 /DNA_ORIENTATION=+